MNKGWKVILLLSSVAVLSSCASIGDSQSFSSFSVNGSTFNGMGMDLRDPHFYMDDDKRMAPFASDPRCC